MNKEKRYKLIRNKHFTDVMIILIFIVLIFIMMLNVSNIQGTARIVNYAGIIRGGTQRLVKLEITGTVDKELEDYLEEIITGLKNGSEELDLIVLKDEKYQEKLDTLFDYWQNLKQEIEKVRQQGESATDIIEMSEVYFNLADETVSAAENYSQKLATTLRIVENILTLVIVLTIVYLVYDTFHIISLLKMNDSLKQKAYLDQHTGLPNKSKCEEIFAENLSLKEPVSCIMFDMNGLKAINDTLGHVAGDKMIGNFAGLLKRTIPNKYFVARYGGDEFIAVLENSTDKEAKQVMEQVCDAVEKYNADLEGSGIPLSFASGYAAAEGDEEISLRELLERADENMYTKKKEMKEKTT